MKTSKTTTSNEAKLSLQVSPLKSAPVPISALVDSYAAAAQSSATQPSYDAGLRHFKNHGGGIPASAEMIAEYLATCAGTAAVATLQHRLIAIHRAHTDLNISSPVMERLVKRTMQGIRRTFGTAQRRVKALVKDDLLEMLVLVDKQRPMKVARDKALLLIGFAGAFRRSELVALRWKDITQYDSGMELLLRRSKTDQEGAGRTVFVPYARGIRCRLAIRLEPIRLPRSVGNSGSISALYAFGRSYGLTLSC